jgi:hypothetical protein
LLLGHAKSLFNELNLTSDAPINLRGLHFVLEVWADADLRKLPALDIRRARLRGTHARYVKFGSVLCNASTNWSLGVLRNCDTSQIRWKDARRQGLRLRITNTNITEHYLETPAGGSWTLPIPLQLACEHSSSWLNNTNDGVMDIMLRQQEGVHWVLPVTRDCTYALRSSNRNVVAFQPKRVNKRRGEIFASQNGNEHLTTYSDGRIQLWQESVLAFKDVSTPENKTDKNGNPIRRYSVPNPSPPFEPSWAEFDEQGRLLAYNDAAAEHWLFRIRDGVAEPIEAAL